MGRAAVVESVCETGLGPSASDGVPACPGGCIPDLPTCGQMPTPAGRCAFSRGLREVAAFALRDVDNDDHNRDQDDARSYPDGDVNQRQVIRPRRVQRRIRVWLGGKSRRRRKVGSARRVDSRRQVGSAANDVRIVNSSRGYESGHRRGNCHRQRESPRSRRRRPEPTRVRDDDETSLGIRPRDRSEPARALQIPRSALPRRPRPVKLARIGRDRTLFRAGRLRRHADGTHVIRTRKRERQRLRVLDYDGPTFGRLRRPVG